MSRKYTAAEDALPQALLTACTAALNGSAVQVRVRAAGGLSNGEKSLGETLALKLRNKLDTYHNGPQTIYFRGTKRRTKASNRGQLVQWLLSLGHTQKAIADVYGVSQPVIARFGASLRGRGGDSRLPTHAQDGAALLSGLAVLERSAWGKANDESVPVAQRVEALMAFTQPSVEQVRHRAVGAGRVLADLKRVTSR